MGEKPQAIEVIIDVDIRVHEHHFKEPDSSDEFRYIHVAVTEPYERTQIHKMVRNIVRLPKMKQICDELYALAREGKILKTIKPESMLAELRRMGMPPADHSGFSDQNFYSNYRVWGPFFL